MAGMTLSSMRTQLRIALDDTGSAVWTDDALDNGITQAVADLSRMLPRQQVMDYLVDYTVTSESVTLVAGTKAMANQYIKYDSEVVQNSGETVTYTRDTDYTMDYANGVITRISSGSIGATDTLKISYTKSRVVVDVSSITGFKQVLRVEYPISQVPQKHLPFNLWGDYLFIGAEYESQERMADKKHAFIYYLTEHTPPSASAGTYAEYLDEVVLLGAQAYALFLEAISLKKDSGTDLSAADAAMNNAATNLTRAIAAMGNAETSLTGAGTSLTSAGTALTAAGTALDKVTTLNADDADIDTALNNARTQLSNVVTDLTSLGTALTTAGTALAQVATLNATNGDIDTELDRARSDLNTWDDKINLVNIGNDVAALGRLYAESALSVARERADLRDSYIAESAGRIGVAARHSDQAAHRLSIVAGYISESRERSAMRDSYVAEAAGRVSVASRHIDAADRRNTQASQYISEARGYIESAAQNSNLGGARIATAAQRLTISDRYNAMATERQKEFWAILKDRAQLREQVSRVSVNQPK